MVIYLSKEERKRENPTGKRVSAAEVMDGRGAAAVSLKNNLNRDPRV